MKKDRQGKLFAEEVEQLVSAKKRLDARKQRREGETKRKPRRYDRLLDDSLSSASEALQSVCSSSLIRAYVREELRKGISVIGDLGFGEKETGFALAQKFRGGAAIVVTYIHKPFLFGPSKYPQLNARRFRIRLCIFADAQGPAASRFVRVSRASSDVIESLKMLSNPETLKQRLADVVAAGLAEN